MESKIKKGYQFPAGISSPYLTYQQMLIKLIGSTKIIIFLLLLSSCASIKVNGVEVKAKHRKALSSKDAKILGATAVLGFALGVHYKEDLKKIGHQ